MDQCLIFRVLSGYKIFNRMIYSQEVTDSTMRSSKQQLVQHFTNCLRVLKIERIFNTFSNKFFFQ